ncbi:hypothetical protein J4772_22090 [Cohnella sp. LGH]|uniref:hypothetical protein n=1 Tax=Cohnella sp. LGH TaxID=1619153 RepID=UPI001ADC5F54|nr:hypothetical protein [Cohnella sp. LGH]QTH40277.1 hypothetical protein J4772_22090 [Cohnella sp. LGH]
MHTARHPIVNPLKIDTNNPYHVFNQMYDKSKDFKLMQSILNEVKKYDIFDFIARVSALNLVPENQNKSILFDALIASLLSIKRAEYTSFNKMSNGKFRRVISQVESMDLKLGLDPSENAFIENVMFYNNYFVFPGINYKPGYCLQMMIKTLFLQANSFETDFIKTAAKLTRLVLTISDLAATQLGYKLENLCRLEHGNIVVPDSEKLKRMSELCFVDDDYIRHIVEDDSMVEELYSKFGQGDLETALNTDHHHFFKMPFIKTEDGRSIIINISILSSFVFHKIIWLADKYGCRQELIDAYNASAWRDCRRSLSMLGHKKIQEKNWGINLLECNHYKEILLNVCNNQIMIMTFICDDGKDYSNDLMFSMYPSDHSNEILNERIQYLHDKLSLQNINYEDIFHVIIINSFGRAMLVGMNSSYYYKPLSLNPHDLKCIAINERSNDIFLPRYIRARNKLKSGIPNLFSELNSIEVYVDNQYSFYLNDEFNPKNSMLYIGGGDSIDYILRAVNKEKRHLVESYEKGYFVEVVLNDEKRGIFTEATSEVHRASMLVEFPHVCIWIFSPEVNEFESINIYFSIVDSISYWLAECREVIERCTFTVDTVKVQIELTGNYEEYYYEAEQTVNWADGVSFMVNDNNVTLNWTPEAYRVLSCKDNSIERQMMESIFDVLKKFTVEGNIKTKQFDSIFANPMKKKFFALEYTSNPYFKPLVDGDIRKIKPEDENELLDEIGSAVLASGKWSYGIVKDEERSTIANYVVGYLYKLLQKQVEELQSTYLVELICLDLEKVMYNLMLTQMRYAYDVACYPEKQEKMFENFNELNKTSRALKFLAEYIAACPPNGTQILGEWKYEKLLAICSLIIDWAYKNDLFYYNIFNTPVEILKSDRVGMRQDEFNKLNAINFKEREVQLKYSSSSVFRENLPHTEFHNVAEDLNTAFLDEYGFSFDDFCNCIFGILSYGNEITDEVKRADKSELISWLVENGTDLNTEKMENVLQYISLTKREDYLKPARPYRSEDVYPWRFNRELSFSRRPIILRENEVIWGNRQLFHMLKFTLDLIHEGQLKTRGKKLAALIGKISNKRGDDFNHKVFNKINEMPGFIVDKNIKKINQKNIADEKGNTLGDIDVLYILPNRKQIVVVEVKDFNYSKSPYEMDCEYQKMFVDKGDKKSFATKHKRRAVWVKEHLEDLKTQYRLAGDGWTVKRIFIVSESIISNAFYNAGETIITFSEISKDRLQRV